MTTNVEDHYQLSDHFFAKEFKCHDGTPIVISHISIIQDLLEFLERLRCVANWEAQKSGGGEIGIHVVSGYRHSQYNKDCGGAKNSGHLFTEKGAAADVKLTVQLTTPLPINYDEFWKMCCEVDRSFPGRDYRLGNYAKSKGANAWVHVGCDYGVGGTRWFK